MPVLLLLVTILTQLAFFASATHGEKYSVRLINPKSPDQDILIIGSMHMFPWEKYPHTMVEEMLSKDKLILEILYQGNQASDALFAESKEHIEKLISNFKANLIKDQKITIEEVPWPEALKKRVLASKKAFFQAVGNFGNSTVFDSATEELSPFLQRNLEPALLGKQSLAFANPFAIEMLLSDLVVRQLNSNGIDAKMARSFQTNSKTAFGLEDPLELFGIEEDQDLNISASVMNQKPEILTQRLESIFSNYFVFKAMREMGPEETLKLGLQMLKQNSTENALEFENYLSEGLEAISGTLDKQVIARNKNWAERIPKILGDHPKSSFTIVVGAKHLVGEKSVLEFLKKKGFKIISKVDLTGDGHL